MERRLAAIVAADIVGYGRLLAEDEAATLAAMSDVRKQIVEPALAGTSGQIFRLLGDSTLVAFGSVLEAVQFAIKVQRDLGERNRALPGQAALMFRMGLNLGDIVMSGGEFHGDGITIAVRLEALAPAGGICISQAVHAQIASDIAARFEPLGLRQLKSVEGPVAIWRWSQPASQMPVAGPAVENVAGGQQILDPKVAHLLVVLHMRSARLALSETLDETLSGPGAGRGLALDDLYARLGNHLNQARALLANINVRCIDNISDYSGGKWAPQLPMSEFITGVFDSSDTSYAFKLLPLIKAALDSDKDRHDKRIELMRLFDNFMTTEMIPRTLLLMKYAFVDL